MDSIEREGPVTGTELLPLESGEPLDWGAVSSYLQGQGLPPDPAAPRRFPGGLANLNYLVSIAGRPVVLRRPPPGDLPPGANDMAREHLILSRLAGALPFVPCSLHLCTDATITGAPFQLLEYRQGLVVRAEMPSFLAAHEDIGVRLGAMLIDTLAQIHAVDPVSVGLGDLGRPSGFLARAVSGWRKRADGAYDGSSPMAFTEIGHWLERNAVPDGAPTLLHNDFKLDNVILDPATLTPVAVLDWDQGTRGDPLFDLATMLSYWTEADDPPAMHALRQMPTAGHGFPPRATVVEAYGRATGRDTGGFVFHRVLAMFKLAVVFAQLHARFRSGATTDTRYAGFGELAAGLADFTHDIAHGRAF